MIANLRYIISAVLLVAVVGFAQACASSGSSQFNSSTEWSFEYNADVNVVAPDFTATEVVTEQNITLSDYKGSVILLNFVNYGCSSSINNVVSRQLLDIKEIYEQMDDFIPLSVFCGCCPEEVLRDFAEENGLMWPWILDTDYSILSNYENYLRIYGYPTLVYIDSKQNIREIAGYSDQDTLTVVLERIKGESK